MFIGPGLKMVLPPRYKKLLLLFSVNIPTVEVPIVFPVIRISVKGSLRVTHTLVPWLQWWMLLNSTNCKDPPMASFRVTPLSVTRFIWLSYITDLPDADETIPFQVLSKVLPKIRIQVPFPWKLMAVGFSYNLVWEFTFCSNRKDRIYSKNTEKSHFFSSWKKYAYDCNEPFQGNIKLENSPTLVWIQSILPVFYFYTCPHPKLPPENKYPTPNRRQKYFAEA